MRVFSCRARNPPRSLTLMVCPESRYDGAKMRAQGAKDSYAAGSLGRWENIGAACKIVMLSRFAALSVSLTLNSLFQTRWMGSTSRRTSTVSDALPQRSWPEWHTGLTVAAAALFRRPDRACLATALRAADQPPHRHDPERVQDAVRAPLSIRVLHHALGARRARLDLLGLHRGSWWYVASSLSELRVVTRHSRHSSLEQLSADTYCLRVGQCKSWWMRTTRQPRAGASR